MRIAPTHKRRINFANATLVIFASRISTCRFMPANRQFFEVAESLLARYDTSVIRCGTLRNSFRRARNIKYRDVLIRIGYAMHQSVPYISEMTVQKPMLQGRLVARAAAYLNFKTPPRIHLLSYVRAPSKSNFTVLKEYQRGELTIRVQSRQ